MKLSRLFGTAVLVSLVSIAAQATSLVYVAHGGGNVGAAHGGEIGTIDLDTGTYIALTESLGSLTSLVSTGTRLYAYETQSDSILEIDPSSGAVLSSVQLAAYDKLTDMAYDPTTGIFYGVGNAFTFYSIDIDTGIASFIGAAAPGASGGFRQIGFAPDGTLYLHTVSSGGEFYTINPSTGAIIDTLDGGVPGGALGLAVDPATGLLIASECCRGSDLSKGERLFTIDLETGIATLLFDYDDGRRMHDFAFIEEDEAANEPPLAYCIDSNVTTEPDSCQASTSIDNGSFDPDDDPLILLQNPESPYGLGDTLVTLTVSDDINEPVSCSANVHVRDNQQPLLSCPPPLTVQCEGNESAVASFNTTATDNCSVGQVSCLPASGSSFALGETPVHCSVQDGSGNLGNCDAAVIVIDDIPPTVSAGPDQILEATSAAGASTSLPITSSDSCSSTTVSVAPELSIYPVGLTTVVVTATDTSGNSASTSVSILVQDSTPPLINSITGPGRLWPPNHKMVSVSVVVDASDAIGGEVSCSIVKVRSNEPVSGTGRGDIAPDWGMPSGLNVDLRAERSGSGSDRVYTLTVECSDDQGNSATASTTAIVPHSQNDGDKRASK